MTDLVPGAYDGVQEHDGESECVAETGRRDRGAAELPWHVEDRAHGLAQRPSETDVHGRGDGQQPHVLELLRLDRLAEHREEEAREEDRAVQPAHGSRGVRVQQILMPGVASQRGDDEHPHHSLGRSHEYLKRHRGSHRPATPRALQTAAPRCDFSDDAQIRGHERLNKRQCANSYKP